MVAQHYRWDFIGLSTDDKPTPETSEKVTDGSTFYCADNSKLYVYCQDGWYEKEAQGGGGGDLPIASADTLGGIKVGDNLTINSETGKLDAITGTTVLSANDYDTHASGTEDDGVGLWKRSTGIYIVPAGISYYVKAGTKITPEQDIIFIIYADDTTYAQIFYKDGKPLRFTCVNKTTGNSSNTYISASNSSANTILIGSMVTDNLTTTLNNSPLSANQGKVLKGLIDALDARVTALGG